jgi:hypothetical protein
MFRTIVFQAIVICALAINAQSQSNIRTSFVPDAVLSSNQLDTVIKLAHKCGVKDVAEVRTSDPCMASVLHEICVQGVETVRGRRSSFVTVCVDFQAWMIDPTYRPKKPFKSIGKFWVEARYDIQTNTSTIFTVNHHVVHVNFSGDMPLETADKIVSAFAEGKVRYKTTDLKAQLQNIDFTQPEGLGRAKVSGTYRIGFSEGSCAFCWVEFMFGEKGVVITKVDRIVA